MSEYTPKSRKEGKTGGMNHTSSGHKTVKRGGDANRTRAEGKKSGLLDCGPALVLFFAVTLTGGGAQAYTWFQLVS